MHKLPIVEHPRSWGKKPIDLVPDLPQLAEQLQQAPWEAARPTYYTAVVVREHWILLVVLGRQFRPLSICC
jgi:hypothetical protein